MELNHEKCQCKWGKIERRGLFGVVTGLKGKGSGLLTAPLALYRPPEELLYMPCHIHGVVQVKLSVSIQHRVTPVTRHRVEPDHTQTSWQNITKTNQQQQYDTCTQMSERSINLLYLLTACACSLSLSPTWTLSESLPWTVLVPPSMTLAISLG